jgi:hypothetical protein
MKKIAIVFVASILLLTGCSYETKTVNNLEYVAHIKTRHDDAVQFKDKEGKLYVFYLQHGSPVLLDPVKRYNITVTIENTSTYGDFIEDIQEAK